MAKELVVKKPSIPQVNLSQDETLHKRQVSLSGKLMTAEHPVIVGTNFRTLTNMRYGDASPKQISGMTKINSSVIDATYSRVKSAFQFRKIQPADGTIESHILCQAYDSNFTGAKVFQNITAPPAAGDFEATELWPVSPATVTSGVGIGRFSGAPSGLMAYCNGVETCVWGGNGIPCTAFVTSSAVLTDTSEPTDARDYSDVMLNTKTDADNVAEINLDTGIDSYAYSALHFNGTNESTVFSEAGNGGLTWAAYGDAELSTSVKKFGLSSMSLGGAGYANSSIYGTTLGAEWTVELFARVTTLPGAGEMDPIFNAYQAGSIYGIWLGINHDGRLVLYLSSNGSSWDLASAEVGTAILSVDTFYHIALVWTGSKYSLYVDGTADKEVASSTAVTSIYRFAIGTDYAQSNGYLTGYIDEFRYSKDKARWTTAFSSPTSEYGVGAVAFLVRSPLPLEAAHLYVSYVNATASVLTVKEWDGGGWSTLTVTDNTRNSPTNTITLYQSGTVTWTQTGNAKLKYLNGMLGYWYMFSISAGHADISYITIKPSFQKIIDVWDGIDRDVGAFFIYTTTYSDKTLNVTADEYDTSDTTSYADLSSLGAFSDPNNALIVGLLEKAMAFNISVPSDRTNSTAATSMAIDYYDGTGFVSVGAIVDGTSEGSISLAKSGTVSFTAPTKAFKTTVANNSVPMYYYRIRFDKALDVSTAIYYISGIPAPSEIRGYKFPLFSQDRLMLCANMDGKRNSIRVSSQDTAQVFNGQDSFDVEFGDQNELNCGTTVFSMYGNSLYNITILFKDKEMWGLVSTDNGWKRYRIADVGCNADLTLATAIVQQGGSQVNRCFAIWANAEGVFTSDGRHPVDVSRDIRDLFDQNSATHINLSYIRSFTGFVDIAKSEYHLNVALTTDAVTALDAEYVLDLVRWKWFKVDRGTGNYLRCGLNVIDSYGNNYTYGFKGDHMLRLEYGNTFDNTSITSTLHTGDFPLAENDFLTETTLKALVPILASKLTTTADMTLSHYWNSAVVEMAPSIATANWTLGSGWESPITSGLNKNADATGTAVPTMSVEANKTYKVIITLSALTAGTGAAYTLGGTAGSALSSAATFTDYIVTTTTGALTITPTSNETRFVISSISVTEATDYAVDPTSTNRNTAYPVKISNDVPAILHSIKMSMATSNESCGFEPLMLGLFYLAVREHDYA